MSASSVPETPKWRSGPFVYGAILASLPLCFLVLWTLPTLLPSVLRGNVAFERVLIGTLWGALIFLLPLGAFLFRQRYQFRDDWLQIRRWSIVFATASYVVDVVSYAAIAAFLLKLNL